MRRAGDSGLLRSIVCSSEGEGGPANGDGAEVGDVGSTSSRMSVEAADVFLGRVLLLVELASPPELAVGVCAPDPESTASFPSARPLHSSGIVLPVPLLKLPILALLLALPRRFCTERNSRSVSSCALAGPLPQADGLAGPCSKEDSSSRRGLRVRFLMSTDERCRSRRYRPVTSETEMRESGAHVS